MNLQFYNQRISGGGTEDHLFPHSGDTHVKLPSSVPSPRQVGEFSCPQYGQTRTVMVQLK